jgi:hypothetical protein
MTKQGRKETFVHIALPILDKSSFTLIPPLSGVLGQLQ